MFYITVPTCELADEDQSRREFAVCWGLRSPGLPAGMGQWGARLSANIQLFAEGEEGEEGRGRLESRETQMAVYWR